MEEATPKTEGSGQWYRNDEEATKGIEQFIDRQTAKAAQVAPKIVEAKTEESKETPETQETQEAEETKENVQETQQAQEEAQEEDQIASLKRKVRVKNDLGQDEEVELTIKELESSVMMQRDYQRKTAELARQREQVLNEYRERLSKESQNYLQQAQGLQKALMAIAAPEFQIAGIDINNQLQVNAHLSRLAKDDPAEAVRLSNRLNEVNAAYRLAVAQAEQERGKLSQSKTERLTKQIQESSEKVQSIPGWGEKLQEALVKTGLEYGFSRQELTSVMDKEGNVLEGYIPAADHRFMSLLNDAYQYRQQQQQKVQEKLIADKKVAAAPKVLKPGSQAKADTRKAEVEDSMKQLRKRGRVEDAAAVFERML